MRRAGIVSCLTGFALSVAVGSAVAQTTSKPIFTDYPPYLCVGGGFVAMAGIGERTFGLVVIPIDFNGIEAPQTIPLVGDAVFGMQCNGSHIELLVNDYKSGRFLMPLYTVEWHSRNPKTISEEHRGASTYRSPLLRLKTPLCGEQTKRAI